MFKVEFQMMIKHSSKLWIQTSRLFAGVILVFGLNACGRITISGSVTNRENNPTTTVLRDSLQRGDQSSVRVLEMAPRPETESIKKPTFRLEVNVEGKPNDLKESYRFLSQFQNDWQFFAGTSADRDFVINRYGGLINLNAGRNSAPQLFDRDIGTHIGASYLMVIQDNERVVPWEMSEPPPGAVDMRTLTRQLFEGISDATRAAVRTTVAGGSVFNDELALVPRVVSTKIENAGGGRARGFGFIYRADIQVPGFSYQVFVPISFLFQQGVPSDEYRLLIDPIGLNESRRENLDRILVRGSPGANLLEGTVRDSIRDSIASFGPLRLPGMPDGVQAETLISAGLQFATRRPTPNLTNLPFEVVLVPEAENVSTETAKLWTRGRSDVSSEGMRVKLVFLE